MARPTQQTDVRGRIGPNQFPNTFIFVLKGGIGAGGERGYRGIFEALSRRMHAGKAQAQLARLATKAAEEPGGPPPDKTQEGGSNGTVSSETQLAAAYSERCGNLSALAAQVYFCFLPSPLYLPLILPALDSG